MPDISTIINATILNHILKKKVQGLLFRLTRVSTESIEDRKLQDILEKSISLHEKQELILSELQK